MRNDDAYANIVGNVKYNVIARNVFSKELDGWHNLRDAFLNIGTKYPGDSWNDYPEDSFKPNSSHFRSDEFTDKHNGKHILFSGCSVTYGQGLYTSELWSHRLYNKISEKEKLSGYFNLGTPGRGIVDLVASIFKYCDKYGNPDSIFIDFPDTSRSYFISDTNYPGVISDGIDDLNYMSDRICHGLYVGPLKKDDLPTLIFIYQSLMMLEVYCKSNNIKLFLYSYVQGTENFMRRCNLNNLYSLDDRIVKNKVFEYQKNNKDDKFVLIARDNQHLGTGFHYAWSEIMFDHYIESLK
jgi:hypothetical protein